MADFPARIRFEGDARSVERAIDRLEKRLERLRNRASEVFNAGAGSQKLLPQASLTRAEKFDKVVDSFYKKLGQIGSAFANAFAPLALASGLFDKHLGSLNEELNVVSQLNKRLNLMVDTTSQLDARLRGVSRSWSKITYDFDVYNALAKKQVELEDRRNEILRRQAEAIRRQRLEQERGYEAVRRNVRASEAARAESGFAAFSQDAPGAVRRRVAQDKQAEIEAINDIERLRDAKSLNSYNTRQRRIRYLAKLQEDLDAKLERSRDSRRARRVRAEKDAAQEAAKGLENLLLGAGFPLLFGGGAGAVGGGVLGSLFGEGFGGQIFVGAIGQQIDNLVQSSIEFARAFREGGDAAGALQNALGYLNPEVSSLISNLQQSGQTARAAAVAQSELAAVVGDAGAAALRKSGEDADRYQRSIQRLGLQFYASAQAASQFFQSLRGDYGQIPGLAPSVSEKPTSQAARDREAALGRSNVLLNEQVKLSGLSQTLEFDKYVTQLRVIANQELINEKASIKLALDRGEITLAERKLKLDAARLKNQQELNRINKLINERSAQEAKTAAREAQQAAEAEARAKAQSLKTGERLINQLKLQVAELDGTNQLTIDYNVALEKAKQLQDQVLALKNAEQQDDAKLLVNELLRLETRKAYIDQMLRGMAARQDEVKAIEAIANENKYLQNRLVLGEKEAVIRQKIASLIEKGVDPNLADRLVRANAALQQMNNTLDYTDKLLQDVVNGIGTQIAGVFDTLIQGTNDWNQVLTSTLRSLSSLLLKAGFSALGSAGDPAGEGIGLFSILSGNFGKRADGGPVSANRPYLVGEEGPEMFVPGKSGTIVPNGAGGGVNSVVNVTINGDGTSNVDSSQGAELGRLINSSVTAILMRERRPGGMLAR